MGRKLNTNEIIYRSKKIHLDKYDYSLVEYINDGTKIKIICPIHGVFEQRPGDHIRLKHGCPTCGDIKNADRCRKPLTIVMRDIIAVWGDQRFDFSKLNYVNSNTKIELKCLKHNEWFFQYLGAICKNKIGCNQCQIESRNTKNAEKYKDRFIRRSKEIHGNLYDYSKVCYINQNSKVIIGCKKHGDFLQNPGNHVSGNGCQKCSYSKGEHAIAKYLELNNFEYIAQYKVIINGKRHYYDFYVPGRNMMIEFNGLQHYKPIKWTNSTPDNEMIEGYNKLIERDNLKESFCIDNKIKFLVIPYYSLMDIPKILESNLINCVAIIED